MVHALPQVHEQVADLLRGPPSVRIGRDAQDVHSAGGDLQDEEHLQPPQRDDGVNVEKITGQQG